MEGRIVTGARAKARATSARSLRGSHRDAKGLLVEYAKKRSEIDARLAAFRRIGGLRDDRMFEELCFCLLAVQSSARRSDAAVRSLRREGLLFSAPAPRIADHLRRRTRFHNHKAVFIVRARDRFFPDGVPSLRKALDSFSSAQEARTWLVREVDGLGLKEASHFLRNIGRGEELAILDRHILRNLQRHGVLRRLPRSLTPARYLDIEGRMGRFARESGIPLAALDLLFWSRETGEIFK